MQQATNKIDISNSCFIKGCLFKLNEMSLRKPVLLINLLKRAHVCDCKKVYLDISSLDVRRHKAVSRNGRKKRVTHTYVV